MLPLGVSPSSCMRAPAADFAIPKPTYNTLGAPSTNKKDSTFTCSSPHQHVHKEEAYMPT